MLKDGTKKSNVPMDSTSQDLNAAVTGTGSVPHLKNQANKGQTLARKVEPCQSFLKPSPPAFGKYLSSCVAKTQQAEETQVNAAKHYSG